MRQSYKRNLIFKKVLISLKFPEGAFTEMKVIKICAYKLNLRNTFSRNLELILTLKAKFLL